MAGAEPLPTDPSSILRSRQFPLLLVLAATVGVVTSAVAWGFLELIYQIQQGVYTHLPKELGFDGTPEWWPLPVLAIAGGVTAIAIVRLPGTGGHIPAEGLNPAPTHPIELPGVVLAALASIGLGAVVGPEAPLIALGGGLGFVAFRLLRRDGPPEVGLLLATASTFAAISFLFGSPLIAAVLLIEAAGLGGPMLPLMLLPGLTAAGIGSLISIGLGQWTGLSSTHISIGVLPLAPFARPDITDFAWTIPLAAVIALGTVLIFRIAKEVVPVVSSRPLLLLPAAGLAVAGLAIAFQEAAGKNASEVLFSGQGALSPLVGGAGAWSLSALALLIAFKGVAYAISLGSFRGGPTFPAMFLGTAAGLMAAQLPGFEVAPAVAVGIGAAIVAVLRLPLTAVVLALLLTSKAGLATGPLIIVGVVVAYLTTLAVTRDGEPTAAAKEPNAAEAPS
ncbi:MAG: chloride channel protein [Solirubrobacterales bacterium]